MLGAYGRVYAMLQRILLSRQAKSIVAHGVQHIEAFQAFVAAENIAGNVAERMAHMQAGTAGVRKHIEHIILGLAAVVGHLIRFGIIPLLLPFFFNGVEVVFHE